MSDVKVIVLAGYGQNCDYETAHAFEAAGALATRVHINSLIDGTVDPDDFQIMAFGGGFSWGDDHGAGVIQAIRLKTNVGDKILSFIEKGKLVIGICNGFQTLANLGLLPGIGNDYRTRSVALTFNDCGNFRDQWVDLKVNEQSPCVFTRGMTSAEFPVRHGEGKFYAESSVLQTLKNNNQIVLQYADKNGSPARGAFPQNPNGSVDDIAGICDETGRIFGLMPHPEAFIRMTNHPDWTRKKAAMRKEGKDLDMNSVTDGLKLFKNAVDYISAS
jgi:phosphoribosylformylglycinamidine synthase